MSPSQWCTNIHEAGHKQSQAAQLDDGLELNHIQNSRLHSFDYADTHLEQNLEPFRFQKQAWILDLIIGKVICSKANYESLVTPGHPFTMLDKIGQSEV